MDGDEKSLIIKGLYGAGGLLAGFVGGMVTLYLKTREQRADYENLKRTRRLKRTVQDERIDRAIKIKEIMVDLAKHNIPHDKLVEFMPLLLEGEKQLDVEREYLPLAVS